jgi:transposase InsO family protein
MKYQFIDTYRSEFAVERMCRVFKVSKSGYYVWRVRPQSKRARANEQLDHHIKTIYRKNKGMYGSPRITKALKRQNIACSENRVARRMRINGIKAKTKKRFKVTTNSKHNHPVAKNLLNQNFNVQQPNQVWVSDITYIWTREGWMYLAVIVDLFSRHIVLAGLWTSIWVKSLL